MYLGSQEGLEPIDFRSPDRIPRDPDVTEVNTKGHETTRPGKHPAGKQIPLEQKLLLKLKIMERTFHLALTKKRLNIGALEDQERITAKRNVPSAWSLLSVAGLCGSRVLIHVFHAHACHDVGMGWQQTVSTFNK
jgi:hypothetical protein